MKLLALAVWSWIVMSAAAQNYNITFRSKVEFPGQNLANIWGASINGKEYALVGAAQGMYIIDVTDPDNPVTITQLTDGITSSWREIKTAGNYAYITSEGLTSGNTGGLGIANLSGLPNLPVPFQKYYGDGAINNQLQLAHALHVDEGQGYAYIYGTRSNPSTYLANGGAIVLNLNTDPYNPTYAGQYNGSYIHDGYVKNGILYGAHIYQGYFSIINFTNKSSPVLLGTQITPGAFTHNTWLSQNGNYLFTTDEKTNAYLTAYDISNTSNIVETDKIRTTPGSGSIVHNTYVNGNYAVTSWYTDGVTITDVSRPTNLIQVGRYDTYSGSGNGFSGAWGVYPYLPSGNLLVTNIQENLPGGGTGGVLYILTPTYVPACYLEGNVKDFNTGSNLSGVSVEIQHTDPLNSTSSLSNGNYATGQPTPGTFDVVFSKSGYVTKTVQASLATSSVTTMNVELSQTALPAELLNFTGKNTGTANLLEWATAQEYNIYGYEIQRKSNPDEPWTSIGFVRAAGNIDTPASYFFTDREPAMESYYRLRITELNGAGQFSPVIHVNLPKKSFEIVSLRPVPATGFLQFEIHSDEWRIAELKVFDTAGRVILFKNLDIHPGNNQTIISLPDELPNGHYLLNFKSGLYKLQETFLLLR